MADKQEPAWTCHHCHRGNPMEFWCCLYCGKSREYQRPGASPLPRWWCDYCATVNHGWHCRRCGNEKPKREPGVNPSENERKDQESGTKFDGGKVRFDLLPPVLASGIATVLSHGAEKYGAHNWMKGLTYSRAYGALQRHLNSWWAGETYDDGPDGTGEHHLFCAGCCLAFLAEYEHDPESYGHLDDRPGFVKPHTRVKGGK